MKTFCLATILLAAGRSSRMGRPKLLLPWGNNSILGHLLKVWSLVGAAQIAVVLAKDSSVLDDELKRLKFPEGNRVLNPVPDDGMFSSIQCAARWAGWNSSITHFAISLGDQPQLKETTLRSLIDFSAAHPENVCQPSRGGKRRHPVILPKRIFTELATSSAANLKDFLGEHSSDLAGVESDDAGLDFDLDTPVDYEQVRILFPPE
ncbi:MAG TPA: nucleotidyltransferase family protein [Candidatus Paceibacterota bacterium]|nr:nucleotidyltransferase family protein [Candidatus Paceibacterota bacterium]